MPNDNLSGVNQPLNQHPKNSFRHQILGADGLFFASGDITGAAAAFDTLFVPPPPVGVIRRVGSPFSATGGIVNGLINNRNGGALDPGISYVLKRSTGEAVITAVAAVPDDDAAALTTSPFYMTENDLGIYLRINNATTAAPVTDVEGYSFWEDVRNVQRQDTVMNVAADTLIEILSGPAEGNVRQMWIGDAVPPTPSFFLNLDPAVPQDVTVYISDGTNDIPLLAPITVAPEVAFPLVGLPISLLPGWSLKASMDADVGTIAPVMTAAYTDTNYGPVRPDQGGAY